MPTPPTPVAELPPLSENGHRPPQITARVREIWRYRELLSNLVRRDLKSRYKNSVLGFLWTLLNPLLYLVVFSIVFGVILRAGVPLFGLFLLSGLLVFNLFSVGLSSATTSITGNGPLVQKVWFPREILPLAAIGSNLITFVFQAVVLLLGLAVFRQAPAWSMLWLLIPALLATVLLALGLGLILSAVNVYFRDVQHFLELGLLTWFWFTPIVYRYDFVGSSLIERWGPGAQNLAFLNPMTPVVVTFQRVLYNPKNLDPARQEEAFSLMVGNGASWYIGGLAFSLTVGALLVVVGALIFRRLEANLGEQI